jgi:hypothetical protein
VKGILADVHMGCAAEAIFREIQSPSWIELWQYLRLVVMQFDDVGLTATSTDLEIWQKCQLEELVLLTNNRNEHSVDSLEATIRLYNTAESLPVFTVGDFGRLRKNRTYAARLIERFYDYLLDIDRVRGAGRLYLP